ncbi:BglG family transcription antiterminator LicT [Terribacillus sp. 179-K 1B1 HS]|uniref:BglG family transcription antiterminator LicT n=1 Tax=Terribacillus sp. 179-K 1B1 HS TaxID=3142388 RepID=UPI0039A0D5E1
MRIARIINNNVVSVYQLDGTELVVMGKGLAFHKKVGDRLDDGKIQKIFTLKDKQVSNNFQTLLRQVPMELASLVETIVQEATVRLQKQFHENIYVALTDHIHFAIERHQQGYDIKNALLWETKQLYPAEFDVGKQALAKIKESLGYQLPDEEAGLIAIHFINAEMNEQVSNTMDITRFVEHIMTIVKYHYKMDLDENSLNVSRFITHLRYFAQRIFTKTFYGSNDAYLYTMMSEKYPEAADCSRKIKDFIVSEYGHELTNEEMFYLTIHLQRVMNR